jgi:hypothetical protein
MKKEVKEIKKTRAKAYKYNISDAIKSDEFPPVKNASAGRQRSALRVALDNMEAITFREVTTDLTGSDLVGFRASVARTCHQVAKERGNVKFINRSIPNGVKVWCEVA